MTYCIAIRLKSGIIFASDSRTSAGVDNVSVFCKTHRFQLAGEKEIFLLTAGNLGTTQEVISILRREIHRNEENNILALDSLFEVARRVGDTVRSVIARLHAARSGIEFGCSFLVGGQFRGESQRLFLVYSEGNFIEATRETPFFQIGELKYGKPILDRMIAYDTSIADAIKCALVSFDSTMRSNLSVGLPINIAFLPRAQLEPANTDIPEPLSHLIGEDNASYQRLRQDWRDGLERVFSQISNLDWWNSALHPFEE